MLNFREESFVEFSKRLQDKIVGTARNKATVFFYYLLIFFCLPLCTASNCLYDSCTFHYRWKSFLQRLPCFLQVYDVESGRAIVTLYDECLANHYSRNR